MFLTKIKVTKIIGIILALSALMFLAGLFRIQQMDLRALLELPPCLRIGGPSHHYFQSNCKGVSKYFSVEYSINEDGLRERPFSSFEKSKNIFLLGDSAVEGWRLNFSDTLGQQLEQSLQIGANSQSVRVVNGGVRFSGPVLQSLRASQVTKYKSKAIFWFLNENDPNDDRLSYGLSVKKDSSGIPTELGDGDFRSVDWIFELKKSVAIPSQLFDWLLYQSYSRNLRRFIRNGESLGYQPCAGIRRGLEYFEKVDVPVYFVLLPLGPNNVVPELSILFEDVVGCLSGKKVLDLRKTLGGDLKYYIPGDTHFNASGNGVIIKEILTAFPEVFPSVLSR